MEELIDLINEDDFVVMNETLLIDIVATIAPDTLMPRWAYQLAASYLILISLLGVTMNLGVIVVIINEPQQQKAPLNWLLVNLAFSDGWIAGFGAPVSAYAAFYGGWPFSYQFCVTYAMIMSTAGIASITTLTILALWRCAIVVVQPANGRLWGAGHHLGNRLAVSLVTFIWVYSLAVTVPPLIGWGRYDFEAAHISCSVNWESKMDNNVYYIMYMFLLGLFVPVLAILVSYVSILNVVHKQVNRHGGSSNSEATEKRVTLMVAVMIAAFITSWTPYSILALIETFGMQGAAVVTPGVATVPSLFAKSSSFFDPLVYGLLNSQFRTSWYKFVERRRNDAGLTYAPELATNNKRTSAPALTTCRQPLTTEDIALCDVHHFGKTGPDEKSATTNVDRVIQRPTSLPLVDTIIVVKKESTSMVECFGKQDLAVHIFVPNETDRQPVCAKTVVRHKMSLEMANGNSCGSDRSFFTSLVT